MRTAWRQRGHLLGKNETWFQVRTVGMMRQKCELECLAVCLELAWWRLRPGPGVVRTRRG